MRAVTTPLLLLLLVGTGCGPRSLDLLPVTAEQVEDLDEDALRAQLAQNPDSATLHHQLGQLLYVQNRFYQARHHWTRALELDPTLDAAKEALSRGIVLLGKYPIGKVKAICTGPALKSCDQTRQIVADPTAAWETNETFRSHVLDGIRRQVLERLEPALTPLMTTDEILSEIKIHEARPLRERVLELSWTASPNEHDRSAEVIGDQRFATVADDHILYLAGLRWFSEQELRDRVRGTLGRNLEAGEFEAALETLDTVAARFPELEAFVTGHRRRAIERWYEDLRTRRIDTPAELHETLAELSRFEHHNRVEPAWLHDLQTRWLEAAATLSWDTRPAVESLEELADEMLRRFPSAPQSQQAREFALDQRRAFEGRLRELDNRLRDALAAGEPATAIETARTLASIDPPRRETVSEQLRQLAQRLEDDGNPQAASRTWNGLADLAANPGEARENAARLQRRIEANSLLATARRLLEQGYRAEARAKIEAALKLVPAHPDADALRIEADGL